MTRDNDTFTRGLAEHIESEAGGEAGRFRVLTEGAAIALGYITKFGELEAINTEPLTIEQVRPGAMSLEDCPLVNLFYANVEDVF